MFCRFGWRSKPIALACSDIQLWDSLRPNQPPSLCQAQMLHGPSTCLRLVFDQSLVCSCSHRDIVFACSVRISTQCSIAAGFEPLPFVPWKRQNMTEYDRYIYIYKSQQMKSVRICQDTTTPYQLQNSKRNWKTCLFERLTPVILTCEASHTPGRAVSLVWLSSCRDRTRKQSEQSKAIRGIQKAEEIGNRKKQKQHNTFSVTAPKPKCQAMPSHAKPCQAMPGHAKPCQAMPSHAKPCQAMPGHAKPVVRYRQDCTKPKDLAKLRAAFAHPKLSDILSNILSKWPVIWPGHSTPKYARVALVATWNIMESCRYMPIMQHQAYFWITRHQNTSLHFTHLIHIYSMHRTGAEKAKVCQPLNAAKQLLSTPATNSRCDTTIILSPRAFKNIIYETSQFTDLSGA